MRAFHPGLESLCKSLADAQCRRMVSVEAVVVCSVKTQIWYKEIRQSRTAVIIHSDLGLKRRKSYFGHARVRPRQHDRRAISRVLHALMG